MSAALDALGAGVTGAAGIASTAMTNSSNKKIAQMNNQFNERMLQKQMDYNSEMYDKQLGDQWSFYNAAKQNQWDMFNATNEYNTASSQRMRLEAAGLNPYLMMQGASAGTASSVSGTGGATPSAQGVTPPSAQPYSANFEGYANAIGRSMDFLERMQNIGKAKAEKEQVQIENQYRGQKLLSEIYNKIQSTKNDSERTQMQKFISGFQSKLIQSQIANNEQSTVESRVRTEAMGVDIALKQQELYFLPVMQRADLGAKIADIALKQKQGQLTAKQAEHEAYKIADTIAGTKGKNIQNESDEAYKNIERTMGVTSNVGKGVLSILKQLLK